MINSVRICGVVPYGEHQKSYKVSSLRRENCRKRSWKPFWVGSKTSVGLEDMTASDYVVEAATENLEIRSQIFKEFDSICSNPGRP